MNTLFDKPEYFVNRELSWLKFNTRVLQEADVQETPLMERLKFIAITASNLDEFFMIRVAGLKHQLESGINKTDAAGLTVQQQLEEISRSVHNLVTMQYRYLMNIMEQLKINHIFFKSPQQLDDQAKNWLESYYNNNIFPVITPMAVDSSRPFPFLANRSLNLAICLKKSDGEQAKAVVQIPAVLPRVIEVPAKQQEKTFVFLGDVIKEYCQQLFQGCVIEKAVFFRITRNADLFLDEEDADDLLIEVEKSLRRRKWGQAVRLEIQENCEQELENYLLEALNVGLDDVYEVAGPIDLTCFFKFSEMQGYDHLKHPPIIPQVPADLVMAGEDIFSAIREHDIMVHHPYESFEPVIEFVQRAAADPDVLAIKQTLYRVSGNSPVVKALAQAAENGKQVTVLVELKARFDEEKNILWARRLEEAGCHVIYGLVGLKTHAKITLVVRKESSGIRRYVHVSTGNYNDATAKVYTDIGIFTINDQFGADASAFFNVLSGYSEPPIWNKFVVAPLGLRDKIKELINREIDQVKKGNSGHIIAKMNSLLDKDIIMKLYEASSQGVKIELIVRGICSLRPGINGVSENITVRSIVGRFLEHSRIFYFGNGGDERIYLSSADWMPRNLNDRVELLFPVESDKHVNRIKEILTYMLTDSEKAYIMLSNGNYRRAFKRKQSLNSQSELYRQAQLTAKHDALPLLQKIKPIYRKDKLM